MNRFASNLVIIVLFLFSCTQHENIVLAKLAYQKIQAGQCTADTINKYHILLPETLNSNEKLPLVLVLDAHGDGKMAVEKFQPAVEYFSCIVVGSDLIENNFPGYEQAINELIIDVIKKYPVDEKEIVLAGFSGGARMAYSFSLRYAVKGALMCGAGPGKQLPQCPVYAISGMGDFNFSENYIPPSINNLSDASFTADYFHGNHEWPSASQISDGLFYLLGANNNSFDVIKNKRSNDLLKIADSLEKDGNYWMAWVAMEKASKLTVEKRTKKEALEKAKILLKDKAFLNTVQSIENDLNTESKLTQAYSQASLNENFNWWKNEITVLNKNLEKFQEGMQADHYMRIKGFIGILLYSRINNMIYNDPSNPQINVLLQTYQYAEPENSYAYYFQALHDFQSSDNQKCLENLDKSLKLGFADIDKMKKDFPENILHHLQ
jgi:predicted esterase